MLAPCTMRETPRSERAYHIAGTADGRHLLRFFAVEISARPDIAELPNEPGVDQDVGRLPAQQGLCQKDRLTRAMAGAVTLTSR